MDTKHSEATKQLLSNVFKGRVFSDDSLDKMLLAVRLRGGNKTSFFAKTHTIETIANMRLAKFTIVKVLDIKTNTVKLFKGNLEAANYLYIGIKKGVIFIKIDTL